MSDYHGKTGQNKIKPGGNMAFGGGKINRSRKVNSIPKSLTNELQNLYKQFIFSGKESNEIFYSIGVLGQNLKKMAGHGNFEKLRKLRFHHIGKRTLQRAMKIAKFFDFAEYPSLLLVPREQLYKITQKYNNMAEVLAILEVSHVHLEVNELDNKQVKYFWGQINDLANGKLPFPQHFEEDDSQNTNTEETNGWTVVGINEEADSNGSNKPNSTTDPLESLLDRIRAEREYYDDCELSLPKEDVQLFSEIMREITTILEFHGPETLQPRDINKLSSIINRIARMP